MGIKRAIAPTKKANPTTKPAEGSILTSAAVDSYYTLEAERTEADRLRKCEFYAALCRAREAMSGVVATGVNTFDHYTYSTLNDLIAAVKVHLAKEQLFLSFTVISTEYGEERITAKGKTEYTAAAQVRATVYHALTGQSMSTECTAEGQDRADKRIPKAITIARRFAIQCMFNLYGEEDPEKDEYVGADDPGEKIPGGTKKDKKTAKKRVPAEPLEMPADREPSDSEPVKVDPVKAYIHRVSLALYPKDLEDLVGNLRTHGPLINDGDLSDQVWSHIESRMNKEKGEGGKWVNEDTNGVETSMLAARREHAGRYPDAAKQAEGVF